MTALADIKILNEMSKSSIKAAQKAVNPPLLIADDGVILPLNLNPGKANFARMDGRSQSPFSFYNRVPVLMYRKRNRKDVGARLTMPSSKHYSRYWWTHPK